MQLQWTAQERQVWLRVDPQPQEGRQKHPWGRVRIFSEETTRHPSLEMIEGTGTRESRVEIVAMMICRSTRRWQGIHQVVDAENVEVAFGFDRFPVSLNRQPRPPLLDQGLNMTDPSCGILRMVAVCHRPGHAADSELFSPYRADRRDNFCAAASCFEEERMQPSIDMKVEIV